MKQSLQKKRGFVCQTFIIILLIVITVTTQMLQYLDRANETYLLLEEYLHLYQLESQVVNHAKCEIVNGNVLTDYYAGGTYVLVMAIDGGYQLRFLQYVLDIYVEGQEIVDWNLATV